jgi:hypothetical protein
VQHESYIVIRYPNGEHEGFVACGFSRRAAEANARTKAIRIASSKPNVNATEIKFLTSEDFGSLDETTKEIIRRDWEISRHRRDL